MSQKYSNDAYSTLAASLGIGVTTMFVSTGHGARWPEVVAPDICYSTLEDPSGNIEIVKITAHTAGSDQMTVVRAQQGTTERGWSIADLVECRVTAGELTAFETDIDALEAGKQPLDADLTALAGLALNGLVARTDAGTFAVRTIQAGAGVTVTYGNGVDGDPVINMSPSVGAGDVLGPASATDSTVALFDGTSGKTLKGSTKALPTGAIVGSTDTQTLTGKSISLTTNTVSGTLAEFSTAVSDADLASLATTQTLTNKTISLTNNTLSGTRAEFNAACSDADFASLTGTETLTNKTVALGSNTVSGTKSQFDSACTDGNFLYVGDVPSDIPTVVVDSTNSTVTASVGNHYVLTKGTLQAVNLPSTHAAGDMIWVTVANGLLTNTIVPNGTDQINGLNETMTLDSAYVTVQLRWIDATSDWRLI